MRNCVVALLAGDDGSGTKQPLFSVAVSLNSAGLKPPLLNSAAARGQSWEAEQYFVDAAVVSCDDDDDVIFGVLMTGDADEGGVPVPVAPG